MHPPRYSRDSDLAPPVPIITPANTTDLAAPQPMARAKTVDLWPPAMRGRMALLRRREEAAASPAARRRDGATVPQPGGAAATPPPSTEPHAQRASWSSSSRRSSAGTLSRSTPQIGRFRDVIRKTIWTRSLRANRPVFARMRSWYGLRAGEGGLGEERSAEEPIQPGVLVMAWHHDEGASVRAGGESEGGAAHGGAKPDGADLPPPGARVPGEWVAATVTTSGLVADSWRVEVS